MVRFEPATGKWLEGNVDIPSSLSQASPVSSEFLKYSLSFGAENLLAVTYQWWRDELAIQIKYEDCVGDP
ncbi:MAG TPA: hypothetical protein VNM16_10385, partial [Bacillota bacterium]|nr:hypothetical protein [Bacillota bacterium]